MPTANRRWTISIPQFHLILFIFSSQKIGKRIKNTYNIYVTQFHQNELEINVCHKLSDECT